MNENKNENGNSEIPEVEELVIEESDDVDTIANKVKKHNDEVAEYKTKIGERNSQLYARTKKAEGFELKGDKWVKPEDPSKKQEATSKDSKDGLKTTDVISLIKANVPEEDMDEVIEYANFKKISISDALKSSVVKSTLAENAEIRKTAEGTNTGTNKRGSSRLSDDALVSEAEKGNMPESDADMKRIASIQLKKNR